MGFASDSDDDFLPFSVPVLAMVAAEVEVEQARATQRGSAAGGEVDGSDPMEWFGSTSEGADRADWALPTPIAAQQGPT